MTILIRTKRAVEPKLLSGTEALRRATDFLHEFKEGLRAKRLLCNPSRSFASAWAFEFEGRLTEEGVRVSREFLGVAQATLAARLHLKPLGLHTSEATDLVDECVDEAFEFEGADARDEQIRETAGRFVDLRGFPPDEGPVIEWVGRRIDLLKDDAADLERLVAKFCDIIRASPDLDDGELVAAVWSLKALSTEFEGINVEFVDQWEDAWGEGTMSIHGLVRRARVEVTARKEDG